MTSHEEDGLKEAAAFVLVSFIFTYAKQTKKTPEAAATALATTMGGTARGTSVEAMNMLRHLFSLRDVNHSKVDVIHAFLDQLLAELETS